MMDNYGGTSTLGKSYNEKAVALNEAKTSNYSESKNIDEYAQFDSKKGVEIAPPPSMSYYNESTSHTKHKYQTHLRNDRSSLSNMEESLKMGIVQRIVSKKTSFPSNWTEDSDTD